MSHANYAMNKNFSKGSPFSGIRSFVQAGSAVWLCILCTSNRTMLFIIIWLPRCKVASRLCHSTPIVLLLWLGTLFGQNELDCGCEHAPPSGVIRSSLVYGLIALPLLLGFLLPDHALGSSMASQKGMSLTYAPPEIRRKSHCQMRLRRLSVQDYADTRYPTARYEVNRSTCRREVCATG